MKTKSKTFQEGDDVGLPIMFTNDVVWDYAGTNDFVDPAEAEYRLKNKVRIIVQIFEDEKGVG